MRTIARNLTHWVNIMIALETTLPTETRTSRQPWIMTVTASLFLLYEFIQMNMFSSINQDLIQVFHIGPQQLGLLSAAYFLANLIFLLPAAVLLDRFSPRILILGTMSICIIGTILFANADSFRMALYCRFATGIGSAFCFLGAIRITSRWFPAERMALPSGIIVMMAMVGGLLAQYPFATLVHYIGWRFALLIDAGIGTGILGIIFLIVRDYPPNQGSPLSTAATGYHVKDIIAAYTKPHNWLAGLYTCFMNLPIFILGGLYGTLFLHQVHQLSRTDASIVTLSLFVGALLGSPLAGWLSDFLKRRLLPMRLGAILILPISLVILWIPQGSVSVFMSLFFLLGLVSSMQIISYPFVNETNPPHLTASATSAISICCIGSGYLFQPLVGKLIEWQTTSSYSAEAIYTHYDYKLGFAVLPVAFIIALLSTFLLRETFCRRS